MVKNKLHTKKNEQGVTAKVKEVKGSFQLTTEIYQRQVAKKGPLSSTHCEIYSGAILLKPLTQSVKRNWEQCITYAFTYGSSVCYSECIGIRGSDKATFYWTTVFHDEKDSLNCYSVILFCSMTLYAVMLYFALRCYG